MNSPPIRGTDDLVKNRVSAPGARYFVTCCEHDRKRILTADTIAARIADEITAMDNDGTVKSLAWVIMPDHIHWLFELGERLPLSRAMSRFKAKTGASLATVGAAWQRNFFEHRLHPDEASEAYARYLYLNPWRASLIHVSTPWPHGKIAGAVRWHFLNALSANGTPPEHWIDNTPNPLMRHSVDGGKNQGVASDAPTTL